MRPDAFLPGTWRVRRELRDAAAGQGRFEGTATFSRVPDGVAWQERGRLRLGRYDGPAMRTLRVVRERAGWMVRFADGRAFHPLELAEVPSRVIHACGDDAYEGQYTVLGRDRFDVRWVVRGPAKAQEIASRYERT
jgi:Family of unknown function (DUF6314)